MVTFSKLLEDAGEGAKTQSDALDEVSKQLKALNFKGAQKEVDSFTAAQRALSKQLKLLKTQTEQNIKVTKERLKDGAISGKKADRLLQQQRKAITELNKQIHEEAISRAAGIEELDSLASAAKGVNEELEATGKKLREEKISLSDSIASVKRPLRCGPRLPIESMKRQKVSTH